MRLQNPACLALLCLALGACSEEPAPPPHVVLVLVDQLREDAVERWMPGTQALGEAGVRFTQMRSAAPWTYPSVISLFSGLYPQQHGADGQHPDPADPAKGKQLSTFEEGVPLFSRILNSSYHTAGFVTNPFLHDWNPFHSSFDHYVVDPFIGSQGDQRGNPDEVWTADMFADDVNREVLAHFGARELGEPEFTYVHYIDVHGPWTGAPFEVADLDYKKTNQEAYASAARYTDQKILELYRYFLERYDGELIFIVTSDHGQELGQELLEGQDQRARGRKNTPHEFNTRIPFLILPSKEVPRALHSELSCSNVDVAPTLLEWLGFPVPGGLAGRSLLGVIRGEEPSKELLERPTYTLMNAFGKSNDCMVFRGKKLVRHRDVASGEVAARWIFDLEQDPRELIIQGTEFGAAEPLLESLAGPGELSFEKHFGEQSAKLIEGLQGLGYIGDEAEDEK